jgi:hypothetical protein
MDFLLSKGLSIEEPLNQKLPTAVKHTRQEEYEAFLDATFVLKLTYTHQIMFFRLGETK